MDSAIKAKRSWIAGTVSDTQDFGRFACLVHVVINQVRIPQHFAGTDTLLDELADDRPLTSVEGAVEQLISDAGGDFRTDVLFQVVNDFLKVRRNRSLRMTL